MCGGRKNLLPGVSGRDSIRQNHRRALDPEMIRPMGIEAGTDLEELVSRIDFTGKTVYVLPYAGSVVPV
ncbi:MAG: lactate racemase domain-containing protein [Lachnospiraceae bacterium]|nr:lactate racemase domain-containing protein [Lachnospiraceae bacterium]